MDGVGSFSSSFSSSKIWIGVLERRSHGEIGRSADFQVLAGAAARLAEFRGETKAASEILDDAQVLAGRRHGIEFHL